MIHEITFDDAHMQVRYNDALRTATLRWLTDEGQTVIADKITVHRGNDRTTAPTPWSVMPIVNPAGHLVAVVIHDSEGDPVMRFQTAEREVLDAALRIVEVANGTRSRVQLRQVTSL